MTTAPFPTTLHTPNPAEGHALARRLAEHALTERSRDHVDMAGHLSATPAPSLETLTAVYFQAVASANAGWGK